jgi:hypothetical protein
MNKYELRIAQNLKRGNSIAFRLTWEIRKHAQLQNEIQNVKLRYFGIFETKIFAETA